MCTVSIVPLNGGGRIVCNRDERRTRPAACSPRAWPTEVSWATYPCEPASGGTWIGVNDDGLVGALLNRTRTPGAERRPLRSRGLIVPALLACPSIDRALRVAQDIDSREFEPFRLVLAQRSMVAVLTTDPAPSSVEIFPLAGPVMFTSSSLGDALVEAPRRALFERLVIGATDRLCGQFRFHRHQWTERPDISVQMERDDAATLSRTTIDATSRAIDLWYEEVAEARSCSSGKGSGSPRDIRANVCSSVGRVSAPVVG